MNDKDFFDSHRSHFKPWYDDRADYNTNAKSYYDDLARKNKLIEMLAKKIWEYDERLDERLEDLENVLQSYLDKWDERIDNLDDEVSHIFVEWLEDGTLEQIINHEVLGNKADQSELDKTNENLARITSQYLSNGTDDTVPLQTLIDTVSERGGGEILLPDKDYYFDGDIHVREGVVLKGNHDTQMTTDRVYGARIILYQKTRIEDIKFNYPPLYNDVAMLVDAKYVVELDRQDPSVRGTRTFVERVTLHGGGFYEPFNPGATPKKIGLKLFSDGDDGGQWRGFHHSVFKDMVISGFKFAIELETKNAGWVNGNLFKNIGIYWFETAVRVIKSSQSKGIDYNTFELYIQTDEQTKEIFLDETGTNNYKNCTIWDMSHHPESRIGQANLYNVLSPKKYEKTRYGTWFGPNRYYLLGEFNRFTASVHFATFEFVRTGNVQLKYSLSGLGGGDLRILKTSRLDNISDNVKFYLNRKQNGKVEVFVYFTNEYEGNLYLDSFRNFSPSFNLNYYTDLGILEELPVVRTDNAYPFVPMQIENENGYATQSRDGTVTQRYSGKATEMATISSNGLFISPLMTWEFPVPFDFVSNIIVQGSTTGDDNNWVTIVNTPTKNEVTYRIVSTTKQTDPVNIMLKAEGLSNID